MGRFQGVLLFPGLGEGIGFDDHVLQGEGSGYRVKVVEAQERLRKGDVDSHVDALFGDTLVCDEVVHDGPDLVDSLLLQDAQAVPVGLAAVEHDGQLQLPGKAEVPAEYVLLEVPRGFAFEVVEARFADHEDFLTGLGQRGKLLKGVFGNVEVGGVGVDANAGVDVAVFLGNPYGGPGRFEGTACGDDSPNAYVSGSLDDVR